MARPSKYESHVAPRLEEIQAWARDGATMEQIAEKLHVNPDSLYEYKKRYPEFSDSLKHAQQYDDEVVNSLHRNTLGFTVKLKKPIKVKKKYFENGKLVMEEEVIEMIDEEMYIHPDTLAQIYWLNNRQPSKWRQKPKEQPNQDDIEQEGKVKDELYEVLVNRKIEGFDDE